MSHKFKVQQKVRLNGPNLPGRTADNATVYEITRLMPADVSGEFSYRIKSGFTERAAAEGQLVSAG